MKYIAHLTRGGTMELELPEELDGAASRTPVFRGVPSTWITDDNGAMVNADHVIALVPVPAAPAYVIDGEGDRWERRGDLYALDAGEGQNPNLIRSFDVIEEE